MVGLDFAGVLPLGISGRSGSPATPSLRDVDPYARGKAALMGNKEEEAIKAYEQALDENPDDERAADAYYGIAKAHDALKEDTEALEAYRTFIDRYPRDRRVSQAQKRVEFYIAGGR